MRKMAAVEELQTLISGTAERHGHSVVGLGRGWALGSGTIIPKDKVLPNAHNLRRGSSGGPLLDGDGRLLGINTIRVDGNLILALPAAALRERVESLARGETKSSPRLGVAVAPPRVARKMRRAVGLPEREGLLV